MERTRKLNMSLEFKDLTTHMLNCHKELNKIPTAHNFKKYLQEKNIVGNPYKNYKHNEILKAANLEPQKTWRITEKEINNKLIICKQKLLELNDLLGKTPKQSEYREFLNTKNIKFAWEHYITYNNMLKELSLELNRRLYTKHELKEMLLLKIKENNGKAPTQLSLEKDPSIPNVNAYISAFKKPYNAILKDLGFEPNYEMNKYTKNDLIIYLKAFYNEHNRAPYYEELEDPSWNMFKKFFGGLENALLHASVPFNSRIFGSVYISNHSDIRPSLLDGKVDDWLFNHGILHEHEVPYQEFLVTDKLYIVDYVISGTNYYIEVAGMISKKDYNNVASLNSKIKKDYIRKLKHKEYLFKQHDDLQLIIIFSDDSKFEEKLSIFLPYAISKPKILREGKILESNNKWKKKTPKKYSDSYLEENIRTRYKQLNEQIPEIKDMFVPGWPNPQGTYQKRGGWKKWLKKSGVIEIYEEKLKTEMLDHLIFIEKQVNRRPYCTDLEKYKKDNFNRDKYRTVFGNWNKTIIAYSEYKNSINHKLST